MDIYVVIVEERHSDIAVYPFSDESTAIRFAKEQAAAIGAPEEEQIGGWLYAARCSTESDYVHVVKRTLDAGV